MEALNELENLAQSSLLEESTPEVVDAAAIRQFMDLFDLNEEEATEKLNELRGFIPQKKLVPRKNRAAAYLVMLQGPLPDAETVQAIGGLIQAPETMAGTDDSGREARFCRVDHATRSKIATHFADNSLGPTPTFLQLTIAEKALSHDSASPTLGLDATLPQNRANSTDAIFRPFQEEYPVWYFFYGPLADPKELSMILRSSTEPEYHSATITGGRFLSQNAIVDARVHEPSAEICGKAFLLQSSRDEESVRFSVTETFEVVRCKIRFTDGAETVDGLTLRYVGTDLD